MDQARPPLFRPSPSLSWRRSSMSSSPLPSPSGMPDGPSFRPPPSKEDHNRRRCFEVSKSARTDGAPGCFHSQAQPVPFYISSRRKGDAGTGASHYGTVSTSIRPSWSFLSFGGRLRPLRPVSARGLRKRTFQKPVYYGYSTDGLEDS